MTLEEFEHFWSRAEELMTHVDSLVQSIGDLFRQEEYDAAIKLLGIHFKADLFMGKNNAIHVRYGSVMSWKDAHDISAVEDFKAEQERRREEFEK